MIKVMNKKTYKGPGVYIGRTWTTIPSIFGNPHVEGTREENIANYKIYFEKRYAKDETFRAAIHGLADQAATSGLVLICWCDPLPCHGHVIRDFIQRYNEIRLSLKINEKEEVKL